MKTIRSVFLNDTKNFIRIFRLVAWEFSKTRSAWFMVAGLITVTLGIILGVAQYMQYRSDFMNQGITWLAIWGQALLLPSLLFLPTIFATLQAQRVQNENKANGFHNMRSQNIFSTYCVVNVSYMILNALYIGIIIALELVISGWYFQFNFMEIAPLILRVCLLIIAFVAFQTVSYAIAVKINNFSLTIASIFILTIIGMAFYLVFPSIAPFFPFSLIGSASGVRELGDIDSVRHIIFVGIISVVWAALSIVYILKSGIKE